MWQIVFLVFMIGIVNVNCREIPGSAIPPRISDFALDYLERAGNNYFIRKITKTYDADMTVIHSWGLAFDFKMKLGYTNCTKDFKDDYDCVVVEEFPVETCAVSILMKVEHHCLTNLLQREITPEPNPLIMLDFHCGDYDNAGK